MLPRKFLVWLAKLSFDSEPMLLLQIAAVLHVTSRLVCFVACLLACLTACLTACLQAFEVCANPKRAPPLTAAHVQQCELDDVLQPWLAVLHGEWHHPQQQQQQWSQEAETAVSAYLIPADRRQPWPLAAVWSGIKALLQLSDKVGWLL
jgi:hypothetical protein